MLSNVTTKGQVTIPAEIRARFQIQPNDKVDFYIEGDRIIITPVKTLRQLRGAVTPIESSSFDQERQAAKQAQAERISGEEP